MLQLHLNLSLFIVLATGALGAAAPQREVPYFVDVAGPEFNLEQEIIDSIEILRRPPTEQRLWKARKPYAGAFGAWRAYLRSDGIWMPDPLGVRGDYTDHSYPVEYVLPFGYRGVFQVLWGVPGAAPLQIVNKKIEVYIPASGVVETSSPSFLDAGTMVSAQQGFYFERDGERTVVLFEKPSHNEVVSIMRGPTSCPSLAKRCDSYFVGSWADWDALTSGKCRNAEERLRMQASGHACYEMSPGTTQPVSELVQPHGQPAVSVNEFHGRTLNGRRVTLALDTGEPGSWRYEGPDPVLPDWATLALELKAYIRATLAQDTGTTIHQAVCTQDQVNILLRLSAAGPYRFIRAAFSGVIAARFMANRKSHLTPPCDGLVFIRKEQGWKLIGIYPAGAKGQNQNASKFTGTALIGDAFFVRLREDGTWEADDGFDQSLVTHTGHDLNGSELAFEINEQGQPAWHPVNDKAVHVHIEAVFSQLNQAMDQYIELLSSGNVKGFLEKGGGAGLDLAAYELLRLCGDQIDDLCEAARSNSEKITVNAIGQVDIESTLQEMKQLRTETPRVFPVPFSPDYDVFYTLPPKEPGQSQITRQLKGHGSTWTFKRD